MTIVLSLKGFLTFVGCIISSSFPITMTQWYHGLQKGQKSKNALLFMDNLEEFLSAAELIGKVMYIFRIVVKLGASLSNFCWVRAVRAMLPIWSTVHVLCAYKPRNSGKFYWTPFSLVSHLPCPSLMQPWIWGVSGCRCTPRPTSHCQHPTSHGHVFLHSALRSLLATAQRCGAILLQGSQEPGNKCTSHFLSSLFLSVWGGIQCASQGQNQPLCSCNNAVDGVSFYSVTLLVPSFLLSGGINKFPNKPPAPKSLSQ